VSTLCRIRQTLLTDGCRFPKRGEAYSGVCHWASEAYQPVTDLRGGHRDLWIAASSVKLLLLRLKLCDTA